MTIECAFAISRHELPEVCIFVRPLFQRAQGRPGACCTRGLACDLRKQKLHTTVAALPSIASHRAFVTFASALIRRETSGVMRLICVRTKAEYFFAKGWTDFW